MLKASAKHISTLVSTRWLAEHTAHVKVVDASWHLPSANRDAKKEYMAQHLQVFTRTPTLDDSAI
ncbi:hypothetical protein BDK51DRAFT_53073 [Blyttiomyces helicus]|uniref:Uncharacterized protein n=1 Tax=Blyttiomyces helicus TaxID=388810 RepID=A0A4P9W3E1_9FUNG|nr:hypothetical protein BDK51DRAFT_53073 [Blyttiomyces helicus]|eukprot:RKO85170.1 hypothetical protein BDK51DRAFT_53073 [Blyttiomyces helicus]